MEWPKIEICWYGKVINYAHYSPRITTQGRVSNFLSAANLTRSVYCFVKGFIERKNRFGNQMYFFQMKNELNFTQSRQRINYYELTTKEMN